MRIQTAIRNGLLAALSKESLSRIQPRLTQVELPARMVLVERGEASEFVYFLESGLASIIAASKADEEEIEVGHIGPEGMAGFHVLHDTDRTPNRVFMRVNGTGWRLPVHDLIAATSQDDALRRLLLRYVQSFQTQLSHSALANGRYNILERLARWLLMSNDRLENDDIATTHELLSLMLGVRRSSVTADIHTLEGRQLIKATRARITILDRAGLETVAGGCYGLPEAEYERLIGHSLKRSVDGPEG